MDEPAIRENLPLKASRWIPRLEASVKAFRLATSGVPWHTQIHTHMCFSNFVEILPYINRLDADVISIEDFKMKGVMARSLADGAYTGAIGPGCLDVHTNRIPSLEEVLRVGETALQAIPPASLWFNPDCGYKRRPDQYAIPQMQVMMDVARQLRARVDAKKD